MEETKDSKIKTRAGSGYLKQLYSSARVTAGSTHSHLKNLTTILVNFVPVEKVDPSELQVRTHFNVEEIQALAYSIKEHGVLQPILVVQNGDRYKVIAGERRLRATKMAGLDRIPARIITTDDKATHEIALRENLDRVDLHPIEEGEGYVSLLESQAYTSYDAIAKAFGKQKSRITETIGFTRLPAETKVEIMKHGIKNRSFLRQLATVPAEKHLEFIQLASGKDDHWIPNMAGLTASENVSATTNTKPAPLAFAYFIDESGVRMPAFRWKKKEPKAKLEAFRAALQNLLVEIEPLLKDS